MAKRLKIRLSRILSNCRSKDVVPSHPLPLPKLAITPSSRSQAFRWKQEKDFHVVSISTVRVESAPSPATKVFPRPSVSRRARRRRATILWGRNHGRVRLAPLPFIGGGDTSWDEGGCEEEDKEDKGYSTSSPDKEGFDVEPTAAEREQEMPLMRRRVSEVEFEARLSLVERRWCRRDHETTTGITTTTKVRESYAVVKRTEDPYGEFRRSMMEMVTEKEIYEEEELRELLRCLLSLNGMEHHGIILQAFAEVCDALFPKEKEKKMIMLDYYSSKNKPPFFSSM